LRARCEELRRRTGWKPTLTGAATDADLTAAARAVADDPAAAVVVDRETKSVRIAAAAIEEFDDDAGERFRHRTGYELKSEAPADPNEAKSPSR
jgi:hypothetical protein